MAKFPVFEEETAIQPVAAPNLSSSERAANQLEGLSDRVGRQLQDIIDFDEAQKGKAAGADLDFQEKTPITEGQRIFENRALKANQVSIYNNLSSRARELFNQEIKPGNFSQESPANFRKSMAAYTAGVIQTVPKGNRQYAENVADRVTQRHLTWLTQRASKLSNQQAREELYEYLDKLQQTSQNDLIQGDIGDVLSAGGAYGLGARKLNEAAKAGVITGEQAWHLKNSWKSQLQISAVTGKYRDELKNGNGQKALADFIDNPPKDMSFNDQQVALNHMRSLLNAYKQAGDINSNLLITQMANSIAQTSNGNLDPDSPEASQIFNNIAQTKGNDSAIKYSEKLTNAQRISSAQSALRFVSPDDFAKSVNKIRDKISENPKDASRNLNDLAVIQKVYNKNRKEFINDPAGYVSQSPYVMQAASAATLQQGDQGFGILQGDAYTTTNLNQAMIHQQLQLGASLTPQPNKPLVSLIPNEKAKEIAGHIISMPTEDQIGAMQEIEEKFGKQYAPIAFRDLQKAGLPFFTDSMYQMSKNSPNLTFQAVNAFKQDPKQLRESITKSDMNSINSAVQRSTQNISASFQGASNFPVSEINSLQNQISQFAQYLLASGKYTSASEAVKQAENAFINNNYDFTSYSGSTLRIPKDKDGDIVDKRLLKEMMKVKEKEDLKDPILPRVRKDYPGLKSVERNAIQSIKDNSHWTTLPDDTGVFMVDSLGAPVVIQDKESGKERNIQIKFDQVENNSSELATKAQAASLFDEFNPAINSPFSQIKRIEDLLGISL